LAVVLLGMGIVTWFVFDHMDLWIQAVVYLKHSLGALTGWVVMLIVLIPSVLGLLALPLMRRLRQRWLWRDSGMVRSKRQAVPRSVNLIASGIVLLGIALGVSLQWAGSSGDFIFLRVLFVASGWSLGYTLAALGRNLDLPRYVTSGIAGAALSTLLLLPALTVGQTGLLFGLLWFVLLVASGYGPLRQAMREAQRNG
jgi:hypothetical protein